MNTPSLETFRLLQDQMNKKEAVFKHLGFVDCRFVVTVQADFSTTETHHYGLEFSVYQCVDVREVDKPEDYDPDFVITGGAYQWAEMFQNIAEYNGADLAHTLNRLSMVGVPFRVTGSDVVRQEYFFRYNQSLQEFMNGYAQAVQTAVEGGTS